MLNLVTGGPGSGKTCFLIGELLKADKAGRKLWIHGVPGLTIPHTRIYCTSVSCTVCEGKPDGALLADQWPDYVDPGDVVVLDEVQHVWRPRGAKAVGVPDSLAKLETARHKGLDFWFLTQAPSLIDVHARRLVTRHIHIRYSAISNTRMMYEWPEVNPDPTQTWMPNTVKSLYPLNKEHFPYYKSAEVHTVQERKRPKMLYVYGAVLASIPLLIWWGISMFGNLSGDLEVKSSLPVAQEVNQDQQITRETPQNPIFGNSLGNMTAAAAAVQEGDPFDRDIVLANTPESAPAFRHLVKITEMPRVAGCMMRSGDLGSCKCYTQQGTFVPTDVRFCANFVKSPPFNPYGVASGGARRLNSALDSFQ